MGVWETWSYSTELKILIRSVGLGIRRIASLVSSAFLPLAANTHDLQNLILARCSAPNDSALDAVLVIWSLLHNISCPQHPVSLRQESWDKPSISADSVIILASTIDNHDRARLLASMPHHSGNWLHALPISSCGLRLDNEALSSINVYCRPARRHQSVASLPVPLWYICGRP